MFNNKTPVNPRGSAPSITPEAPIPGNAKIAPSVPTKTPITPSATPVSPSSNSMPKALNSSSPVRPAKPTFPFQLPIPGNPFGTVNSKKDRLV